MSGTTFVNTESGKEMILNPDQAKQFSGVKSRTGGPLWKPKSGKVQVKVKDSQGVPHIRSMSADAYHQNNQLGNQNISLGGGDAKSDFEKSRVGVRGQDQAKIDEESGGTAFGINAVPFGRTVARQFLSGDVAEDSIQDGMRLDAAHPLAAGAGSAAQMILTTAATGGAIGLARTGLAAATAGGAAEGLFAAANTMKAAKLFGFADDAGNFVAGRLATSGANQTLANIVGRGVSSAALTAPASVIYEAAERVDFDKKFTAENFVADVGVDILLGGAFDFGLPMLGKGIKGAGKLAGGGLSQVGKITSALGRVPVVGMPFRAVGGAIHSITSMKSAFTKNAASRAVGGEILDEAAEIAVKRARGVGEMHPAQVATRKQAQAVKDGLDGFGGASGVDAAEIAHAADNIESLAGLRKGVGNYQTITDEVADTMVAGLEALTVKAPLRRAGDLRIDIAMNASALRSALGDQLTDKALLQRIDDLMDLGVGTSRRESVTRALRFRNQVMVKVAKGEVNPSVAAAVRKHIDSALTDAAVTGPGSTQLKRLIAASDGIVDMAPSLKSLTKDLQNLDNIVDVTPAGGTGHYLDEMGAAYEEVIGLGAVSGQDARFVKARLAAGQGRLEKLMPDLEVAATVNKVRNKIAGEGGTILHAPTGAAVGEKLTAAQVESNARFTVRSREMVAKVLASPQAKLAVRS
ncbi:MAG TPA: hypothetical protein VMY39_01675, partial [Planctomycetota bacterium]|nr:hypothetical protein [Planctomycetota bacterium]